MGIPMGDEVEALVVEVGTHTTKAGFSGEDSPKIVLPSHAGVLQAQKEKLDVNGTAKTTTQGVNPSEADGDQNKETGKGKRGRTNYVIGTSSLGVHQSGLEVVPAIDKGQINDWDICMAIIDTALRQQLGVNTSEHCLLFAEPAGIQKTQREKLLELIFEDLQVSASYLARQSVLSCFTNARQTGLVVDCGHEGTVVSAISDGYLLTQTVTRQPLGGHLLNNALTSILQANNTSLNPHYAFTKKLAQGKSVVEGVGDYTVTYHDLKGTTDSFRDYHVEGLVQEIKEQVCQLNPVAFVPQENLNLPSTAFELPDGQEIQVGVEKFKLAESLFKPSLLESMGQGSVTGYDGKPLVGIQEQIVQCIDRCDVDFRMQAYSGLVLVGGSSLFGKFKERLESEVQSVAPLSVRVASIAPKLNQEKRFTSWIGGSILASLGTFQQLWVSKQEWQEHGNSIVHRKCP